MAQYLGDLSITGSWVDLTVNNPTMSGVPAWVQGKGFSPVLVVFSSSASAPTSNFGGQLIQPDGVPATGTAAHIWVMAENAADIAFGTGDPSSSGAAKFWNEATGSGSALAASATFNGTARDTGVSAGTAHNLAYFNAFFLADQAGTATILGSNDGTTFYPLYSTSLAAATPLTLTVPIQTRYYKAQVVNGSTAQTYLWVNTSFTQA